MTISDKTFHQLDENLQVYLMVSQSKVVSQHPRQSLDGDVIWFQALWRKLKLLWHVVLLNAVTTEAGRDFWGVESLHLVNIISLQAQRGSGEGHPIPHPSNPLPLEHLPENQQPAELNGDTETETTIFQASEKQNKKVQMLIFFFVIGKKKNKCSGRGRGHSPPQKNHLTSLLRFMSPGRTLTSQTRQRFCLLNQLGFLRGSGCSAPRTWETFFLFFLVHHQILHPQWAWKVNNSDLAWLSSLPLSHCSVNTR